MDQADPVRAQWKPVGRTANTRYFLAADDVIIVLPDQGLKDDETSAMANMEFQVACARSAGQRCAVVVVLDSLTSQDSEARRIYASGLQPALFYAAALIVTSPLARAIGSFFLGLSRPLVATRLFDSIDDATAWIATLREGDQPA